MQDNVSTAHFCIIVVITQTLTLKILLCWSLKAQKGARLLCKLSTRVFKAAPRGRSRRRLGGLVVAAAPAPPGQTHAGLRAGLTAVAND
jgi:hypothetical protein